MSPNDVTEARAPAWNDAFCFPPSASCLPPTGFPPDPLGGDIPDYAGIFDTNSRTPVRTTAKPAHFDNLVALPPARRKVSARRGLIEGYIMR